MSLENCKLIQPRSIGWKIRRRASVRRFSSVIASYWRSIRQSFLRILQWKYRELMKYLRKILLICSNIIIGFLKNNALFREIIKDLIREILDEREVHKSEKGEEA